MPNYLLIENKGELDINSLILLGASTKRGDDTKIGMFGSGNKYAIATLIRENIPFKIFSGDKEINISTKEVVFRDKTFQQILIDGKETSITTEAGPQWEPWMAIRELVSNAKDEGQENIINKTERVEHKIGFTRFYIEHVSQVLHLIQRWNDYFSWDRIDNLDSCNTGTIFENSDPNNVEIIYRKGIRCVEQSKAKSLFHYDFDNIEINESRIVKNSYDINQKIGKLVAQTKNKKVAYNILKDSYKNEFIESSISWGYSYYGTNILSSIYKEVIEDKCIIVHDYSANYEEIILKGNYFLVTEPLAKVIKKSFPDVKIYGLRKEDGEIDFNLTNEIGEPNQKQSYLLKKVYEFFKEVQYNIDFPIKIATFINHDILGTIKNKEIILSTRLFDLGLRELAITIIEENEHIITGYKDCSRSFQNHFMNLFLKGMEERFGFFI